MLNILDRELEEEEFELEKDDDSPGVLEYFENVYVNRGESLSSLKKKSNISQFDTSKRKHIVKHFIVKVLLIDTNHDLMNMRKPMKRF
jgi:hypothetical protein